MNRREQREQIFKILFGVEFHSADELEEQIGLYMEDLGDIRKKDADYMTGKVRSIVEHMDEIDGMINQASKNWKTTRMAKAELSILRLAAYEIKYEDDIPVSVSINEAVELAKLYGSDHGPAFVNGILSGMV
ncbi:MAG: transcription antitermination factor NusB [Lachnospiraceae bacterium]|nr:transcription antitermination factor NusB [Lachnospiraceae bacterium]